MPRKALIRDPLFPYHITNRTLEKRHYPLQMQKVWQIYADQLRIASWALGAHVHAFVLMSNHYHLLLSTPDSNIDEIVQWVQSQVSLTLFKQLKSKDWSFDTRYKWTLVTERNYFHNVYRYIYQNPLRAGLASTVSDYPFSTFHGKAGYSKLDIPLHQHFFQEDLALVDLRSEEDWLNELLPNDQLLLIRKGIRRFTFNLSQRDQKKLSHFMSKKSRGYVEKGTDAF